MKRIKLIRLTAAIVLLCFSQANSFAQKYTIHSEYGNLSECDTMSKGPILLWWDKDFPLPKAKMILDSMKSYMDECRKDLNMKYPPNVLAGAYVNVYAYNTNCYLSKFVSGYGVGTENASNAYRGPFFSSSADYLPSNYGNMAHETFHLMQYNQTSPGYVYSGNSMWYTEACASFYAITRYPTLDAVYAGALALRKIPQVPMWLSYENLRASSYPDNWQRNVHQYTMDLFFQYMYTKKNVYKKIFTEGYYTGTSLLPQQYIASKVGINNLRAYFTEFAAKMHNNFDFLTASQLTEAQYHWNTYSDSKDVNEFTQEFTDKGTTGWFTPSSDKVTTGWSFNTYKISNTKNTTYKFEINGSAKGSYGDASHFKGKILVRNSNGSAKYYDVPMNNNIQGELTLAVSSKDYEIYLIVASVPDRMDDDKAEFQTYNYQVKISPLYCVATITSPSNSFCTGGSVVLTASTGTSYKWFKGTTQVSTAATYKATGAGSYTVEVTNSAGCIATSAVKKITVNALPTATITSPSNSFCKGGSVVLTASTGTSYKWMNGTTQVGTAATYKATGAGSYTVEVTNASGCKATSAVKKITVSAPTATITSPSNSFCKGGSVVLTASTGSSYKWMNGTTQVGTAATYKATGTGSYTVEVTNAAGCKATSTVKKITVDALPTAIITSPSNYFYAGGSVVLTASSGTSYKWFKGTTQVGTAATYKATSAGSYTVKVTNAAGCVATSAVKKITVYALAVAKTASPSNSLYEVDSVAVTDIEETNLSESVTVYPNPFTDIVRIDLNRNSAAKVEVFNSFGQIMYSQTIEKLNLEINLNHLTPGIYLIQITTNNSAITKTIIKQ
ncbi:MAG: T9SS type A sorting domain-containing protein [Bacteroidetes bacterium]|nr:T9SS type A sorting domain-containing protein [Bacteroidota bacterium]